MSNATTSGSVPRSMKAELIERFGEPKEVMHTKTLPVPELGDDEILIDVRAAGVGVWDPEVCKGEFGAEQGLPRILGSDGSGTVIAKGKSVERFDVGDRVYGYGFMNPKGGFFAEYAAIPEDEAAKVPEGLSLDEAAALAVDGLTALAGIEKLGLERGQTLVVLGASGGVGHLAVEIAKRIGARVCAIASREDGVELARRLGADEVIEGHSDDLVDRARKLAPDGYDAALVLAGARAEDVVGLVKEGGRVAYPYGVEPAPSERDGVEVEGFNGLRGRDALDRLNRYVATDGFHVEISRTYALDDAPKALDDVKGHHVGKLAVTIHGD